MSILEIKNVSYQYKVETTDAAFIFKIKING